MLKDYLKKYEDQAEKIILEPGEKVREKELGFVVSGLLGVYSSDTLLNLLKEEDIFGAAQVFQSDISTIIKAKKKSELLLFSQEILLDLLSKDKNFMTEYIEFMADRIKFLTLKVRTLTSKSCEDRLYSYLLDQAEENKTFIIPMKGQEFSGALNMSRASLYRAMDILEEEGKIIKEGKQIKLI